MSYRSMQMGRQPGLRGTLTRLSEEVSLPFPPTIGDPRYPGADVSEHQGIVNWDLYLNYSNPPMKFAMIRAGLGNGDVDEQFARNWSYLRGKLPRSAYYVLFGNKSAREQAEHFLQIMQEHGGGDYGEGPIVLDVERKDGATPETISQLTLVWITLVQEATGKEVIIYSAAWFVNSYMVIDNRFASVRWWLATWLAASSGKEHPGPPILPNGISIADVVMQQTTNYIDGQLLGMQSKTLDMNRISPELYDELFYTEIALPLEEQVKENTLAIDGIAKDICIIYADLELVDRLIMDLQYRVSTLEGEEPQPPPETPENFDLVYPIESPDEVRLSQDFGINPQWYPNVTGHDGLDWAIPVGTPIFASHDGQVIVSGYRPDRPDYDPYGDHVRIYIEAKDHNGYYREYTSIYGHLSVLGVQVGDHVKQGDFIGLSGGVGSRAGYSTGPHLHFGVICRGAGGRGETFLNGDFMNPWIWLEDINIEILETRKVIVNGLNVRNIPSIDGSIVRKTNLLGVVFNVYERAGTQSSPWGALDISRTAWSSLLAPYSEVI